MQAKLPLSLTLSPSDGEREHVFDCDSRIGTRFFSLSPSDGERARERGCL